ncbi:hypothetical protein [Mammaliicoccus sciuri]|uniref:hypothetical protein n=1 Tax=Mammaliicoccus sciuri TaxID=1296 RepID=UPI003CF7D49C
MIIININIFTQGELLNRYNFLYDHGVELIAAIVTFLAFGLTFYNIWYTNKKDNDNEKKRNHKTLQMIDLITNNHRQNIKNMLKDIDDFEGISLVPLNADGIAMHKIIFKEDTSPIKGFSTFETPFYASNVLFSKYNYLKNENVLEIIERYDAEIKNLVSNHHLNLNNDSIDKITKKLMILKILCNKISNLDLISLMKFETINKYDIYYGDSYLKEKHNEILSETEDKFDEIYSLIKDAQEPIT